MMASVVLPKMLNHTQIEQHNTFIVLTVVTFCRNRQVTHRIIVFEITRAGTLYHWGGKVPKLEGGKLELGVGNSRAPHLLNETLQGSYLIVLLDPPRN